MYCIYYKDYMNFKDLDKETKDKLFSLCNYFNVNPDRLISYLQSIPYTSLIKKSIEDIKKDIKKL